MFMGYALPEQMRWSNRVEVYVMRNQEYDAQVHQHSESVITKEGSVW